MPGLITELENSSIRDKFRMQCFTLLRVTFDSPVIGRSGVEPTLSGQSLSTKGKDFSRARGPIRSRRFKGQLRHFKDHDNVKIQDRKNNDQAVMSFLFY